MDESLLQDRLTRITRLQYLILALIGIQLLADGVGALGVWMTGVIAIGVGSVLFGLLVVSRRRNRDTGEG